ncbi:MAG: response regulator with CheY-like receiver, AAA-type ATPase, and DNA-binding domain [Bacteroidetes bacterium]|nr:MAG: response regulator with CheY-like receiver, AAA-type ATPase, and DNA-binding domain [Bacteroidota bacterium]
MNGHVTADKMKLLLRKQVEAETALYRSDNALILKHYIAEQHKLADVEESLRYARHLHNALLPDETQMRQLFGEAFALNLPKKTISGDFYWMTKAGGRYIIALADCTGHGIPGALMSVLGLSLLNQVVIEERTFEPSHILRRIDYKMRLTFQHAEENNRHGYDGMDIALCTIEPGERKITFAGAMRPLYLFGKNGFNMLRPSRYPIGGLRLEQDRTYPSQELHYENGDMLYLFSDGWSDQFGGPYDGQGGRKLTIKRLREILGMFCHLPPAEQKEQLHEMFIFWKGAYEQTDDAMLIGLKL